MAKRKRPTVWDRIEMDLRCAKINAEYVYDRRQPGDSFGDVAEAILQLQSAVSALEAEVKRHHAQA